jgi:uncharacterized membrane protein
MELDFQRSLIISWVTAEFIAPAVMYAGRRLPVDHISLLLLVWTIAAVVAVLMVSIVWGVICQRHADAEQILPRRIEMRRYMLMGLYCNSDDPRQIVQRPSGRGWTLNMRREELALLLWTLVLTMAIAGLMFAVAPSPGPL